jgi:pimeloyl-ACP methyl ester carboxylesterase
MTDGDVVARWVHTGTFRTRYFEWGRRGRPPVVLLHDGAWGGSALVTWGAVAESLSEDFWVIAPDMLGYGGSDKAVFLGESPYGFRIRHIFDVLRCLCVSQPVHLVGNSFGGSVALRAAADRPSSQIRSVTSVNGSGGPWRTTLALSELSHWDGTDADMARIASLLVDDGPWFDAHVKLRAEEARSTGHYRALKAPSIPLPDQLHTTTDDDWPSGLSTCTAPLLLVGGSRDLLLEPTWVSNVRAGSPNCSTVELDCKHAPNIDKVPELLDVMMPFLQTA